MRKDKAEEIIKLKEFKEKSSSILADAKKEIEKLKVTYNKLSINIYYRKK